MVNFVKRDVDWLESMIFQAEQRNVVDDDIREARALWAKAKQYNDETFFKYAMQAMQTHLDNQQHYKNLAKLKKYQEIAERLKIDDVTNDINARHFIKNVKEAVDDGDDQVILASLLELADGNYDKLPSQYKTLETSQKGGASSSVGTVVILGAAFWLFSQFV